MIFGPVFRRLSCLTFLCGCRFFRTVVIHIPYIMRTHIHIPYHYKLTRAYCKLQKLLPLAKLISKYASWHLMPSVTEVRAKDPAGGLKFVFLLPLPLPLLMLLLSLAAVAGAGGAANTCWSAVFVASCYKNSCQDGSQLFEFWQTTFLQILSFFFPSRNFYEL